MTNPDTGGPNTYGKCKEQQFYKNLKKNGNSSYFYILKQKQNLNVVTNIQIFFFDISYLDALQKYYGARRSTDDPD